QLRLLCGCDRGSAVRQRLAPGEATPGEVGAMQQLVKPAMQDGAFGVGSALIYAPGEYATANELAEITKPAGAYGASTSPIFGRRLIGFLGPSRKRLRSAARQPRRW